MAKKGWVKCRICGAKMKKERLKAHMRKVHPKGTKTKKEKVVMERRREASRSTVLWLSIAVVIVVIILLVWVFWQPNVNTGTKVGEKPPNFTLNDPDGFEVELYDYVESDARPLLLEFMWTNCGVCKQMAPVLHDLYANYSDKVDFLTVASGRDDDKYAVKTFISEHNSQWTYLVDESPRVYDEWGLGIYPVFFIINKEGKIHWTNNDTTRGYFSYDEMAAKFDAVI